jgi:hypothetical protein
VWGTLIIGWTPWALWALLGALAAGVGGYVAAVRAAGVFCGLVELAGTCTAVSCTGPCAGHCPPTRLRNTRLAGPDQLPPPRLPGPEPDLHMTVGRPSLAVVGLAPVGPAAPGAGTPTAAVYMTISVTPSMPSAASTAGL